MTRGGVSGADKKAAGTGASHHLRLVVALVAAVVVGVLVAIPLVTGGNDKASEDTRPAPSPYTDPVDPAFTMADQAFVDFAASQVQEAADLAAIAEHHELPADLAALAERIHAEQTNQLTYLFEMLTKWNLLQMHSGHPHPTPGGLQPGQLEAIDRLSDEEFAAVWAQTMYDHHQGAIYLAQGELRQGANPQAQTLARAMLENAETDRDLLEKFLGSGPSGSTATG